MAVELDGLLQIKKLLMLGTGGQPMNKQIEEMANDLRKSEHWVFDDHDCDFELDRKKTAENLYNADYRKQIEGEWIDKHCFKQLDEFRKMNK